MSFQEAFHGTFRRDAETTPSRFQSGATGCHRNGFEMVAMPCRDASPPRRRKGIMNSFRQETRDGIAKTVRKVFDRFHAEEGSESRKKGRLKRHA